MQPAKISKKIFHFKKLLQKQSCETRMFTCHTTALPARLPVILPHAGAITIKMVHDYTTG
jgi:hypothetical protein